MQYQLLFTAVVTFAFIFYTTAAGENVRREKAFPLFQHLGSCFHHLSALYSEKFWINRHTWHILRFNTIWKGLLCLSGRKAEKMKCLLSDKIPYQLYIAIQFSRSFKFYGIHKKYSIQHYLQVHDEKYFPNTTVLFLVTDGGNGNNGKYLWRL